MPGRNRVKRYAGEQVYHLYNRGNNKQEIFLELEDYVVFLALLKRHLSLKSESDKYGRPYLNLYNELELLAFCLMPNHYHLLIYQKTSEAMTQLMRRVATSYSGYFNKKYGRVGTVFQDVFKASMVDEEAYWQHISRYIHLNPHDWQKWEWSSLPYYLGKKKAEWVRPKRMLDVFEGEDYLAFLKDYEAHKDILGELKYLTAD